ncbi:MAG TPA: ROK family protein [Candidatus Limnocylindrales bacterium]|nr:ROK family protein [Candidatus Limnocylindrales bacterium]
MATDLSILAADGWARGSRRLSAAQPATRPVTRASRHLGLDLGGTNTKWAVVERDDGEWRSLATGQGRTPAGEGPDAVVGRLASMGAEVAAWWPDIESVGIGIPGLYDPATGATRFLVNVPGAWAGRPVAGPVGDALGLPAALINDARAFGLAELRLGAGRGASSMIGLTLGTGVGGVIAIDGRVHQGHDGTAGEIGHQTIDPDGPWCGCGNRGCVEAYARADQIALACASPSAEEAVARARNGDRRALDGLAQVGRYLGIGIANLVTLVSPDRIVIGGGVAAAGSLLFEPILAELHRRVRTTSLDDVSLVAAELGTWAGAIGAAVHGAERAAVVTAATPA